MNCQRIPNLWSIIVIRCTWNNISALCETFYLKRQTRTDGQRGMEMPIRGQRVKTIANCVKRQQLVAWFYNLIYSNYLPILLMVAWIFSTPVKDPSRVQSIMVKGEETRGDLMSAKRVLHVNNPFEPFHYNFSGTLHSVRVDSSTVENLGLRTGSR